MSSVGPSVGDRFLAEFDFKAPKGQQKGIAEYKEGSWSGFFAKLFGKTITINESISGKMVTHLVNKNSLAQFLQRNGVDTRNVKFSTDLVKHLSQYMAKNEPEGQMNIALKSDKNEITGTRE